MRETPRSLVRCVDPRLGFLIVRGSDIDHVAERRIAQEAGAGEGADERHVGFRCDRLSHLRSGRADLPNEREHLVVIDQTVGVGGRLIRLVAIVVRDQLELPPVDATGRVGFVECREDTLAHPEAEGRRRTIESGRLPEDNPIIEDPRFRVKGERHHARRDNEQWLRNFTPHPQPPRIAAKHDVHAAFS